MNIDFIEARKELDKIFETSHSSRKIVFWYDESQNFLGSVLNYNFENVETIIYENNPFKIKYCIEVENPNTNFLLYLPIVKPIDTENWLLDILLYSEEYYADTVALTMRRLNLKNTDLRRVVDRYSKFFDNQLRVSSLRRLIDLSDNTREVDFITGMMAVLVKTKYKTIEDILAELIFDDEKQSKYRELVKFGFEEVLWNYITEAFNYTGVEDLNELCKRFLMTSVYRSSKLEDLPPYQNHFVIQDGIDNGAVDAENFIRRIKHDTRYRAFQTKFEKELKIEDLVKFKGIEDFSDSDVFEIFDTNIIISITESLNRGSVDFDFFQNIINNRIDSKWYKIYSNEYSLLLNIIDFKREAQKTIKKLDTAEEYVRYYEEELYEVDTLYRHIIHDFKKIFEPSNELENLVNEIEIVYENEFLSVLGHRFSHAISKKEKWDFLNAPMSHNFYKEIQKIDFKKMFVIISDALRYEIGVELLNEIKTDPVLGGTATIKPMISSLPSETRFGMASLLPNRKIEYNDRNLLVDGIPTNGTNNRDKILKVKNESFAAIKYEEIYDMNQKQQRQYMSDKSLVYIYHNTIDRMGENNESKVFDAVPEAIDEIIKLIKKLYNNIQTSNFVITADHGFIYKKKRVDESQKYSNILALKSQETSKRFLLTDEVVDIPYTKEFDSYGIKVIVPESYDFFKTQGGGSQYIHGGASLQEVVVPFIRLSELRSRSASDEPTKVGIRLKSTQRKITRRDGIALEFEQYEKVEGKKKEREVEIVLVDEANNPVSPSTKYFANSTSDNIDERIKRIRITLDNIIFDRNNRYYLLIKDAQTNELIDKQQFIIDITNYKAII